MRRGGVKVYSEYSAITYSNLFIPKGAIQLFNIRIFKKCKLEGSKYSLPGDKGEVN